MVQLGFRKLTLKGWRQFEFVELDIHPRLTIITGANGAGKSTLLSIFIKHFGYNKDYLATPEKSKDGTVLFKLGIFEALTKLGALFNSPPSVPPQSGRTIGALEYTNGTSVPLVLPNQNNLHYQVNIPNQQRVPGLHIDSHRPPNIYRQISQLSATPPAPSNIGLAINNEYVQYYQNGNTNLGSLHHIKSSLIEMSMYGRGNADTDGNPRLISLFEGFEEKLRELLPKSLGFRKLLIRSPEVLLSTNSGDFVIDAASGGVIKMIEIAWQIYFYGQNQSNFVVTLDEPENHLHPSMQKSFLPNLLAAFPNTQMIVSTHSPFIISAMRDSNVYVLRYINTEFIPETDGDQSIKALTGARVRAEKLDTINKAGSASEILRDVLGIGATIPDWAEERVREIVGRRRGVKLDQSVLTELYDELTQEGLASSYPTAVTDLIRTK